MLDVSSLGPRICYGKGFEQGFPDLSVCTAVAPFQLISIPEYKLAGLAGSFVYTWSGCELELRSDGRHPLPALGSGRSLP